MSQTGKKVTTVGIVGGGQLGRMLTEAALPLGYKVVVVDPNEDCPAKQAGAEQIKADWNDAAAIRELAGRTDVVTIEVEHVDTKVLAELAAEGRPVHPAPATVAMIQDKLAQKEFLRAAGLPTADFIEITDEASALAALDDFGGQMLVKTRRGAYDGRGNMVVNSPDEVKQALEHFKDQGLYAEQFVPFEKELAVMTARGPDGETAVYPVVETVQARNICLEVVAPAPVGSEVRDEAERVALETLKHLDGAGVFGIEMFLGEDGRVLVNEIAPRVHNSGHYTIEACPTSQFAQHILAIAGRPLGDPALKVPAAAMINILGERDGPARPAGIDKAEKYPHTKVHLYGKPATKVDRKMGHLTTTADSVETALATARKARAAITI